MGEQHNRRNKRRLDNLEENPFTRPVFADHTDEYPDSQSVNGHVPDYVYTTALDETVIGEVEQRGDHSKHSQEQGEAFELFDSRGPFFENETVFYGKVDGLLDWL